MQIDENMIRTALSQSIENSVKRAPGHEPRRRKFVQSVEIIINIRDLDLNNTANRIDVELALPNEVSHELPRICVFADGDMELEAQNLGLAVINSEELENLARKGKSERRGIAKKYEFFIAREDMMRLVGRSMGRFLGQNGKMPLPQPRGYGIIPPNTRLANTIDIFRRVIRIKLKKPQTMVIQTVIGKEDMSQEHLFENAMSIINYVTGHLPQGANNIRSMFFKTTMGTPVKVQEPTKRRGY